MPWVAKQTILLPIPGVSVVAHAPTPEIEGDHLQGMRIEILIRGSTDVNAIDQASALLADALAARGHTSRLTKWVPGRLAHECAGADVLVLPYNPFMWGRRGFAPTLVRDVAALRRRRRRPELVLLMHELYVPITDIRSLVMGGWQRAQLAALLTLSDRRFASIETWAARLSRFRPTGHLPSGSNVPDARSERAATKAELRSEGLFTVATLSTGHPSHLVSYVERVLSGLSAKGVATMFLQLGAGAADAKVPRNVRVERPGLLPAERLAALLAGSDLLLTPFVDGVSTRRGSFMAGLCEEVAVLGTAGKHTDPMLVGRGLELVDVGDPEAYTERAVVLALDQTKRDRVAHSGRALFEREFTWDAIARRMLASV